MTPINIELDTLTIGLVFGLIFGLSAVSYMFGHSRASRLSELAFHDVIDRLVDRRTEMIESPHLSREEIISAELDEVDEAIQNLINRSFRDDGTVDQRS